MGYVVERVDYGRPHGTVYGPVDERWKAVHKAERFAEGKAEGSLVDPKPFKETPGDAWNIEGYAQHGATIFKVREESDT